ncbi:MAG TPA: hypothetical protein VGX16_02205 [Solirubrobacteraceae bacterium]|nr:hypothetical protein [Solirubrobacteraceae bacterium]
MQICAPEFVDLRIECPLGEKFRAGIILHTGAETLPIGERLWALPVSALWRSDGG